MTRLSQGGGGYSPPPEDIRRRFREGTGRGGGGPAFVPGPGGQPMPTGYGQAGFPLDSPYSVKPPSGVDFVVSGNGAALTAVNTPAVLAGSVFQIPENSVGVIRSVVLQVNTLLLTSNLLWTLRFDESAVPGWNLLTVFPAAIASFALAYGPDETYIKVPEGSQIDVQFTVLDAAAYAAGVTYHGWFFNKELADAAELPYLGV